MLVALKYKLLDVQQREIILTRQCSELETELKLANKENKQTQNKYNEIQRQLAMEKVSDVNWIIINNNCVLGRRYN